MKIILIRHGQSESNVDRTILLKKDFFDNMVSLTELGKEQAQDTGERVSKNIKFNKNTFIYYSPYKRAQQTTDEFLKTFSPPITYKIEHPLLIEQEFKDFMNEEEVKEKKYKRNIRGKMFYRYKNGESPLDVFGRAVTFLNDLKSSHNEDDYIIVISHEVMIRCLIHALLHLTVEDALKIDVHNCNVVEFIRKDKLMWSLGYNEIQSLKKIKYEPEKT